MKDQSVFYVYALKDPRTSPAFRFYIGKGARTRAWDHGIRVDQSAKGRRIRQIKAAGLDVLTVKLVEGLSEGEALGIASELTFSLGTEDRGGIPANAVVPKGIVLGKGQDVTVPENAVEKAQIALPHLKNAVFETTKANQDCVTNYEVARRLGLQNDYGGGFQALP